MRDKRVKNSERESCARVHKHNRLNKEEEKKSIQLCLIAEKKAEKKSWCVLWHSVDMFLLQRVRREQKKLDGMHVGQRNGKEM